MRFARVGILILVGTALARPAPAQDLAAAAKREKERRAQQKANKPTKSYSDEDLGKAGAPLANNPSDPPAVDHQTTPASSARAAGSDRGESYWRARAERLRANVAAAEAKLRAAQSAAAAAGPNPPGDYKVRCRPGRLLMPDGSLGPVMDNCATVGMNGDRSRSANARVQAAERELDRARQALSRFEEEARKGRALPGWTR